MPRHPSDLTIRTIIFLRSLDTPEASALADKHHQSDWHLLPSCINCLHLNTHTRWCKKRNIYTGDHDQKPCFQGHKDYLELTAPLKS